MTDTRQANQNWRLNVNPNGTVPHGDAELAVLMDLRDELQKLNRIFSCHNFLAIPHTLDRISRNTAKPKKKKAKAKR